MRLFGQKWNIIKWNWRFKSFKGGFYSVIFSNKRTLLFSWAWILKLRDFKGLKSCQIRAWSDSEVTYRVAKLSLIWAFKTTSGPFMWHDLSPLKSHNFKIQAQENNKVGLFEEMTNASGYFEVNKSYL